MDPVIANACGLVLAGVFAGAAAHKWRDAPAFAAAVAAYAIAPAATAPALARILPVVELGIAIGLLLPFAAPFAAVAAAALLVSYSAAIALNLARGRAAIDCGCGGPPQPLSAWLLLRNGALLLLALAAGAPRAGRPLHWPDWAVIAFAAAAGGLCSAIANQLLANAGRLRALRGDHA